jgi:hypothetical protein
MMNLDDALYQKAKELAIDLKFQNLEDKRLELRV